MILTYKIKHNRDYTRELILAKKVAQYAIKTRTNTSKDVRHLGLPSAISNQILRKYRKKQIKRESSVKMTIPGQAVKFDTDSKIAKIPCLKLEIDCQYVPGFQKIRQIEIGIEFAYLGVDVQESLAVPATKYIGVDCNTTGHAAVAAIPHIGKIHKLGKLAIHTHAKYKSIRKRLQKKGNYQLLTRIKNRESRIIKNINHHISKKLVAIASSEQCGIRFERLKGIRKNKKHARSFRYSLNSWSYYQLQKFTEYKARNQGIEVAYVAPAYTSQTCSRCGSLGDRQEKKFQCVNCEHADHADVNASFNIGNPVSYCAFDPRIENMSRLHVDRDVCKGSTDTPQTAILKMTGTVEPLTF